MVTLDLDAFSLILCRLTVTQVRVLRQIFPVFSLKRVHKLAELLVRATRSILNGSSIDPRYASSLQSKEIKLGIIIR